VPVKVIAPQHEGRAAYCASAGFDGEAGDLAAIRIFILTSYRAHARLHPSSPMRGACRGVLARRSEAVVSPEAVIGRAGEARETCSSG